MSDTHATAIMGNMKVESNFNPNNAQDHAYPGDDNPEYIEAYEYNDGIEWDYSNGLTGLEKKIYLNLQMKEIHL